MSDHKASSCGVMHCAFAATLAALPCCNLHVLYPSLQLMGCTHCRYEDEDATEVCEAMERMAQLFLSDSGKVEEVADASGSPTSVMENHMAPKG